LHDFIKDQKADIDQKAEDVKALTEGGFEADEVRARRDALKRETGDRVARWRGLYRDLGDRREKAIKDAGADQARAYEAAAEIDRRQVDLSLGVKGPRNVEVPEYQPTEKWIRGRRREVGARIKGLIDDAQSHAKGFMEDIADAGDQADVLIEAWADKRIAMTKSWWERFKDWVASFFTETKKQARVWETANIEDNQAHLDGDMVWLAKFQLSHRKGLDADAIDKSHQFTEEQKAMAKAAVQGADSATALALGLAARISQQHRPGLMAKFEEAVVKWDSAERVAAVGFGQGNVEADFATHRAEVIYQAGVEMTGTEEGEIFKALEGLTRIQGRAVELRY
ncbi:MAG: hypothetical protein ACREKH_19530, partial [Candidatus Rokuibacteriota bacterium]